MKNFKTVNKNTNATYYLNEEELINFFKKNSVQNYSITNLTKAKAKKINKILDVVAHLCVLGASILATLLYIQNY
jgi:ADP-dependent phosphofructokinase/glucokinase